MTIAADPLADTNPRRAVTPYTLEKPGQEIHGLFLGGNRVVKLRLLNPTEGEDGNGGYEPTGAWAAADADNILYHVHPLPGMLLQAPDDAPVLGKPCTITVLTTPMPYWHCDAHGLSGPTRPGVDPYTTGPVQCVAARRALTLHNFAAHRAPLQNPPA